MWGKAEIEQILLVYILRNGKAIFACNIFRLLNLLAYSHVYSHVRWRMPTFANPDANFSASENRFVLEICLFTTPYHWTLHWIGLKFLEYYWSLSRQVTPTQTIWVSRNLSLVVLDYSIIHFSYETWFFYSKNDLWYSGNYSCQGLFRSKLNSTVFSYLWKTYVSTWKINISSYRPKHCSP